MARLKTLVEYCDRLLQTREVEDWPGAVNGLQVANRGQVARIAAAVDGTLSTIHLAVERHAQMLIVHHGLFWSTTVPWTGRRYEMLRCLMEHDLAVYSAHLPLDVHPEFGNNVLLSRALKLDQTRPFFFQKGRYLGLAGCLRIHREQLRERLTAVLGCVPTLLPGGSEQCDRIGVVSGAAGAELGLAAAEGVDTFITGEGPHWTFAAAEDSGLNVFYGGHYATETFGVQALAKHLGRRYRLPWDFIDYPTGL